MAKKISLSAEVDVTPLSIQVTGAPGSAGVAVAYTSASSAVTLTDTSGIAPIQYRIDSGPWTDLQRQSGITLPINFAVNVLYLRRSSSEGGDESAHLAIEGLPVVKAGVAGISLGSGGGGGSNGTNGKSVLNGTGAPASYIGTDGDFYLDTAATTLYGPKAGGAWPSSGVLLIGASGNAILNGSNAPTSGTGNNGDFYINTTTSTIYGPKAGGAWPAGVSMAGSGSAATQVTVAALMTLYRNSTLVAGQRYATPAGWQYLATSTHNFIPQNGAPIITGSKLTGIGDSIMAYQWNSNGLPATNSIVQWASSQMENGFDFLFNRGVGGTTIQEMITGQVPATVSDASDTVWIHTGVNNLSATANLANTIDATANQLRTALTTLSPVKQCIIVDALLPFLNSANDRTLEIPKLNVEIAAVCAEFPNVVFNDIYASVLDATSPLGDGLVANFFDNVIHPNSRGAQLAGLMSAKNLASKIKVVPAYVSSLQGVTPALTGTGGTTTPGSGTITGTAPDNVNVVISAGAAAVTLSTKTSTSGSVPARLNVVATNAPAAATQINIHMASATGNNANFPAGSMVQGTISFRIKSQTNLGRVSAYIVQNGSNYGTAITNNTIETPNVQFNTAAMVMTLKTAVLTLAANTTTLDIFLNMYLNPVAGGAIDYDLLSWRIDKVVAA